MVVIILMMFFWVKSPCGLVGRRRFEQPALSIVRAHFSLEDGDDMLLWLLPTNPHSELTQKNIIRILVHVCFSDSDKDSLGFHKWED
jgi:hypothetical protein